MFSFAKLKLFSPISWIAIIQKIADKFRQQIKWEYNIIASLERTWKWEKKFRLLGIISITLALIINNMPLVTQENNYNILKDIAKSAVQRKRVWFDCRWLKFESLSSYWKHFNFRNWRFNIIICTNREYNNITHYL